MVRRFVSGGRVRLTAALLPLLLLAALASASQFGLLSFVDVNDAGQWQEVLRQDGPLLIYLWEPCLACDVVREMVFSQPQVAQALQGVKLVAVNVRQYVPSIEAVLDGHVYVYDGRLRLVQASGRFVVPIQAVPTILLGEVKDGLLHLRLYMLGPASPQEFTQAVKAAMDLRITGAAEAGTTAVPTYAAAPAHAAVPALTMLALSFAAGAASVLSPCVLPILAVTGTLLAAGRKMSRVLAGLVLSFALLGILAATAAGGAAALARQALYAIGGVALVALGLMSLVERLNRALVTWASGLQTRAYRLAKGSGDLALGMSLGALWLPCIAPIFGTVVVGAVVASALAGNVLMAFALTTAYAAGLAAVIYLTATTAKRARRGIRGLRRARYGRTVEVAVGAVAMALGILLIGEALGLGTFTALAGALQGIRLG